MWNKNERDGNLDQAKGRVKQAVGDLTNSDKMKSDGEVDEAVGKGKTAVGKAQKTVAGAIAHAGRAGRS